MNEQQKRYYSITAVKYELIKSLNNRETIFLTPNNFKEKNAFRCIKIHSIQFLNSNFDNFHFFERDMNIYFSLATLDNMPVMSTWMETRKKEQSDFNSQFFKYAVSYDLGFDFEGKQNFNQCYADAQVLKNEFDKYKIPYILNCSGSGIHIRIPKAIDFTSLKKRTEESITKELFKLNLIGKNIKDVFDFETLDANVFDLRRIWKCPYSLDLKSGNVALPLSDEEFENENILDYCKLNYVLHNINLFNRGLFLREGDLVKTDTRNFLKFVKDYDLKGKLAKGD